MKKMKKILISVICLLMAGVMSACTFTVEVSPEDITTVGGLIKDYLFSGMFSGCPDPEPEPELTAESEYGYVEEGMAYREEPAAAEENVGLANPITEYSSLEEINAIAGTALVHPGVMGVTDESFITITCSDYVLADYDFTAAGYRWCFRAGSVYDYDISGVYINAEPAFGNEPKDGIEYAEGEGYKLARWFTLDGQYVLSVEDNGTMAQETFVTVAEEMCEMSDPAMSENELAAYYTALEGSWQDTLSERANLFVTAEGGKCAHMEIYWANSAFETCVWTMSATLSEDGQLYYTDGKETLQTYAEDGTCTETVVSENGEGFFALSSEDGKLYWCTGNSDVETLAAFERVPTEDSASYLPEAAATLIGDWADIFSERAVMSVTAMPGSDALKIQVNWSSAADKNTVWTMTATYDETNARLSYSDCEKTELTLRENASEEATVVYSDGEGYFTLTAAGSLLWNGAAEEDCRACVFVIPVG